MNPESISKSFEKKVYLGGSWLNEEEKAYESRIFKISYFQRKIYYFYWMLKTDRSIIGSKIPFIIAVAFVAEQAKFFSP